MPPYQPYRGVPPYVADNETSMDAALSMHGSAGAIRDRVCNVIVSCYPEGMTCDEVEYLMGLRHQTASARIRELVLTGRLADSGLKRETRSGRNATVWVAPQE